ncbi:Pro-Pol polyprotein, partial [Mucuna pruriens]
MEEVHEGTFGIHRNGHAFAQKILRVGYYWTKMESNCYQHMKRCMKCQICVTPSTLHNLTSPWPFSIWGLDVMGPIEPKASDGYRFILVAIDYFTTLLSHIITDNGTNLNNKTMIELCEQFKISHHNSTPYHPKMNRAVEATNKDIKKIV